MDLFLNGRNGKKGSTSVTEVALVQWGFELGELSDNSGGIQRG
jgi:hypothetical protein